MNGKKLDLKSTNKKKRKTHAHIDVGLIQILVIGSA